MLKYIDEMVSAWGVTGWQFKTLASFIYVFTMMVSIIIIGHLFNKLEHVQMRLVSHAVGNKGAEFIFNRLMFPGTIIHELSHALFAVASGARVTKIRCLTLFSKDTLGYVEFQTQGKPFKRAFQLAFASCAPTVVGCGLLYWFIRTLRYADLSIASRCGLIYLTVCVANHMSMSDIDIKNYVKGCILIFLSAFLFVFAFHHFAS